MYKTLFLLSLCLGCFFFLAFQGPPQCNGYYYCDACGCAERQSQILGALNGGPISQAWSNARAVWTCNQGSQTVHYNIGPTCSAAGFVCDTNNAMLICANVNGCPGNQGLLSSVPVWDPDNLIWVVAKDAYAVASATAKVAGSFG